MEEANYHSRTQHITIVLCLLIWHWKVPHFHIGIAFDTAIVLDLFIPPFLRETEDFHVFCLLEYFQPPLLWHFLNYRCKIHTVYKTRLNRVCVCIWACICKYNQRKTEYLLLQVSLLPASSQITTIRLNINYKLFGLLNQAYYYLALTT